QDLIVARLRPKQAAHNRYRGIDRNLTRRQVGDDGQRRRDLHARSRTSKLLELLHWNSGSNRLRAAEQFGLRGRLTKCTTCLDELIRKRAHGRNDLLTPCLLC